MKKGRRRLLKISIAVSIIVLSVTIFSFALLEPKIKIAGWEVLDVGKLKNSDRMINFLDADDKNIDNFISNSNKEYVPISNIPQHTTDAFVSIEDKRFFKHNGVDYIRIASAFINNIKALSFKEGASTITQQLIKNTHLSSDKKISRKIKEIRIAKELERKFDKSEIMEMYLNMLYFGDNMYGISTASKVFFDTDVSNLTLSQSALLAGIINNPSRYNPYRNPENALNRRNLVLSEMLKNNKISDEEYENARSEKPEFCKKNNDIGQYLHSVIKDAREILGLSKNQLLSENLTIATYYDKNLDDKLRAIVRNARVPENSDAHIVVIKNSDNTLVSDVSLLSDNLSYLKRQPGSTIKPLICYAPALERGDIFCCSPIEDSPASFGDYTPSNYKQKYYGWVSAEQALMYSLNIPAVKLLQSNGIDYGKSICEKAGIDFTSNDNHLALALGGMEKGVTLRQLSDSYTIFSNGGKFGKSSSIRYIKNDKGEIIYSDNKHYVDVISKDTAYLMNTMLNRCAQEGTAKKLSGFGNVCAKTGTVGTSGGNSDVYCIAYSPKYTVGVWVGNCSHLMPNSVSAGGVACQIASNVFAQLKDGGEISKPESVKCRYIDLNCLKQNHVVLLAGEDVDLKDKSCEWFSKNNMPKEFSTPQHGGYLDYDDLLNFDFDNFEIIEGILD